MTDLQQILADCGVTSKILAFILVATATAASWAIRTLYKDLKKERSIRDDTDKENLVILKDISHVLENVLTNVSEFPQHLRNELQDLKGTIKDAISKREL